MLDAPLSEAGNDRIVMGGNNPPVFDAHKANIDDLRAEAMVWLDGKDVTSPEEANAIDTLIKLSRQARDEADKARAAEKKPHDDAAKAVQAKWKPLVDTADTILRVCLEKVGSWRQAEAQRKAAEAARIRAEAEAERMAEIEATRAAAGNLEAREQADQLAASAKQAERVAKAAEKAASTGLGLRKVRVLQITDHTALAKWLWTNRREEVEAAHSELAQRAFRAGASNIGGTEVAIEQKAF